MEKLHHFLKHSLQIPDHLVPKVASFYELEQLPRDTYVLEEGQFAQKLYVIESGYLRFFSYSEKKVITHWIFGTDQLVTDVASFFLRQPAKWNVQALADTTVYALSYANYLRLRAEVPPWDDYEKVLLVKLMSALENRIYSLLSMSTEERYRYLFESDPAMLNELPLQYIASMIGMTPETLSRIRAKFNS